MPEQRSPLKEFRHLEEKLSTVGLSPAEQARYEQLKEIVSPEAAAARPGFDVNAAADALRASLEPAGRRRPLSPAVEPGPVDFAAPAFDAGPGYDPNAAGYDPNAPPWYPNQPHAGAPFGDTAPEPDAQGVAAGDVPSILDAGSGSLDPGPGLFDAPPAWDPAVPGSDDQAAWDAGATRPPLDPAEAFDLNAPPFDAAGHGEEPGGAWDAGPGAAPALEGAPAGQEPGAPSYDLGPAAFDAAALPPELGPGVSDRAPWEAAGAWAPPAGEPVEAELVEAELLEPEPIEAESLEPAAAPPPGAPVPSPDFFTPGPLTPDFTGAQPLDAAAFGEGEQEPAGWPGGEAQPAAWSDATPASEPAPAVGVFEPAPAAGPGSFDAAEPAGALDLDPALGEVEAAGPATAEAPPDPAVYAAAAGEVAIEEIPPVDVDVEEIAEAPPAPLAPDSGGPSPTFVVGEHRVVVHTLEGRVLRGTIADVDLDAPGLPLVTTPGAAPEPIAAAQVKAIFFMLLPGARPPAPEGRKVRVTFRDGRQVAGLSPDYHPEAVGFFMVPADSRTNTGRIWVYREAVRQVSVT